MAVRVKVGTNRDVAIPPEATDTLGIEPGSNLLVEVRGGYIVPLPEPSDYADRLHGLHREVWEGVDPNERVRREREASQS